MKRCLNKECCKNNVDMSSLRATWQNDAYKIQHTEQHKNTTKCHYSDRKTPCRTSMGGENDPNYLKACCDVLPSPLHVAEHFRTKTSHQIIKC